MSKKLRTPKKSGALALVLSLLVIVTFIFIPTLVAAEDPAAEDPVVEDPVAEDSLTNILPLPNFAVYGNTNAISLAGQQWVTIGKNITGQEGTDGVNIGTANTLTLILSDKGNDFDASSGPYGAVAFRAGGNGTTTAACYTTFTTTNPDNTFHYADNPTSVGAIDNIDPWTYPNEYLGSTLHQKMNSLITDTDLFPTREVNHIVPRTLDTSNRGGIAGPTVEDQKLWPLSLYEWSSYQEGEPWVLGTASARFGGSGEFWSRSAHGTMGYQMREIAGTGFDDDGGNAFGRNSYMELGVRPAFTLDLSSVIFTSPTSGASIKASLTEQTPVCINSVWSGSDAKKLTFSDSALAFDLSDKSDRTANSTVTPTLDLGSYTATAGKQISCLFVSKSSEGKNYYEKTNITSSAVSDTNLVISTADMDEGNYTLYVFVEEIAEGDYSDFCSAPVSLDLTIANPSNDAGLTHVFDEAVTWDGDGTSDDTPKTTGVAVGSNVPEITPDDFTTSHPAATVTLHTSDEYDDDEASIVLTAGANDIYVKVVAEDGVTTLYYKVTVDREVSYTVAQLGGTSEIAHTTGIAITFTPAVTGLTADDITLTPADSPPAGAVTKGALTGSGTSWTLHLAGVSAPGNVNVAIQDFNGCTVSGSPKTVEVFRRNPSDDAGLTHVFDEAVTWDGDGTSDDAPKTTGVAVGSNVPEITPDDFTKSDPAATVTLHTSDEYDGDGEESIALIAGANDIYVKVVAEDGVTTLYYKVTVDREVSYTVTQLGGTSEIANTTGIAITFTPAVAGLTADDITLTPADNPAGAVTKGALTGSGTSWTLHLTGVSAPGNVSVAIQDFNGCTVSGLPKTVEVFRKEGGAITNGAITNGAITTGAITTGAITTGAITTGAITSGSITTGDDFDIGWLVTALLFAAAGLTICVAARRMLKKYRIAARR